MTQAWCLAVALIVSGCGFILGVDDLGPSDPSTGGGPSSSSSSSSSSSAAAGGAGGSCDGTSCHGTCVDLQEDPEHCGSCDHSCLGTECSNGSCTAMSLADQLINSVTLAVGDTQVFWTTMVGAHRVPKLGGQISTMTIQGGGRAIAVDETNVFLVEGGKLFRTDKLFANSTTIANGSEAILDMAINQSHVFWIAEAPTAEIRRAPKNGGQLEVVATLAAAKGLVVDESNVFAWHDAVPLYAITSYLVEGSTGSAVTSAQPVIVDLSLDDGSLYWTTETGNLNVIDANTMMIQSLVTTGGESLGSVVADPHSDYVYYAETQPMRVDRVHEEGGTSETIMTVASAVVDLAVDESALYVLESSRLWKIAK